ncbi:methyltransferase type 11 [Micractinium conductrix]|uniref:Methyltransferase type 11 n=1 Tax=Micractinium conductrix TaxID=554055 RepID=A0A2P6V5W3_9CHLO|nr:methyltransferase type 11 [Micractinium conductrix]|eukprot:PSC69467.1 methyltransferase type 11 [Micractinium conductrix]
MLAQQCVQRSPAAVPPARGRRAATTRCQASASAPVAPKNAALVGLVEAVFKFPPFFALAAKSARAMIVKRGERMGMDFQAEIDALKTLDLEAELAAVADPTVEYPSYYKVPFHAYPEGNLGWSPAMEMTVAAKSVHSVVYDPTGKQLDPQGDDNLRSSYSRCMQQLMGEAGARPVSDILDVGASTGLSSLALLKAFPDAAVTGVDLSPYMLAIGSHLQRQRAQQRAAAGDASPERLRFLHAAAEDTRLPDQSFDLVSIMLVCHELPAAASAAIFKEAYRLLRPGGALAVMEMNPASPVFQRVFSNPFAYVAFKSTEPWLLEYVSLDMAGAMADAGFLPASQLENSPRHRTVFAVKPQPIGTGSVTGTSLPSPDVDEAPTDPGTDALFYWELPAQLAGVAEPGLCEWNVGAEELVAAGPTERRSSATAAAGAPLGLAPDGRPFLWRGVWRLEGGWCGFAALVAGNYTRQPQIRFRQQRQLRQRARRLQQATRRQPPAVLLMTYPAFGFASESGMNVRVYPFPDGVIGASATLAYEVYFPPDFDWMLGGKLPGLRQGDECSGGRYADTCFSFRLNWQEEGEAQGYFYAPIQRQVPEFWRLPNTGQQGTSGIVVGRGAGGMRFRRSAWNAVRIRLELNDPGVPNGLLEFAVNNVTGVSFRQAYFRGSPHQLIEHIFLQSFYGGHEAKWAPATAQRALFRRFALTA